MRAFLETLYKWRNGDRGGLICGRRKDRASNRQVEGIKMMYKKGLGKGLDVVNIA
tara:strand:- start:136 stop:300 length:165 start_codon:yes stop_codon:yes gene_type:complete